ncbi:MAG: CvpA family protein [Patescibacteria group bacterium]|jgi:uncharacterized membrane protein required for colicin V production
MATFDILLLVFIGGFVAAGFFAGLFQTLGALLGTFVGYYIAIRNYADLAVWLEPIFFKNHAAAAVVAFVIIFLVINRLVGLFVWVLAKTFQWLKFIPFFSIMNRISGALLGLIEGFIVVGIVIKTAESFIGPSVFSDSVAASQFAQFLIRIADLFNFVLPKLVDSVVS